MMTDDTIKMPGETSKGEPLRQSSVRKSDLQSLIRKAGQGDQEAARRLISPFVSEGETLINFGISAKFGLMTTYDFFFVTDRQVGDMEITPLTGNLNVEVAYISSISAFLLKQPSFSILLRMLMWLSYVWLPVGLYMLGSQLISAILGNVLGIFVGLIAGLAGIPLAYVAINPSLKRSYLRFRKSGLYLILKASTTGVLIFADRDKFEMITKISRQVSEIKRRIDERSS